MAAPVSAHLHRTADVLTALPPIINLLDTETLVGRSFQACNVALDCPKRPKMVSRVHALFATEGDGTPVSLADQCTTNGTLVNGQKIQQPVQLCDGDEITFGTLLSSVVYVFHYGPVSEQCALKHKDQRNPSSSPLRAVLSTPGAAGIQHAPGVTSKKKPATQSALSTAPKSTAATTAALRGESTSPLTVPHSCPPEQGPAKRRKAAHTKGSASEPESTVPGCASPDPIAGAVALGGSNAPDQKSAQNVQPTDSGQAALVLHASSEAPESPTRPMPEHAQARRHPGKPLFRVGEEVEAKCNNPNLDEVYAWFDAIITSYDPHTELFTVRYKGYDEDCIEKLTELNLRPPSDGDWDWMHIQVGDIISTNRRGWWYDAVVLEKLEDPATVGTKKNCLRVRFCDTALRFPDASVPYVKVFLPRRRICSSGEWGKYFL